MLESDAGIRRNWRAKTPDSNRLRCVADNLSGNREDGDKEPQIECSQPGSADLGVEVLGPGQAIGAALAVSRGAQHHAETEERDGIRRVELDRPFQMNNRSFAVSLRLFMQRPAQRGLILRFVGPQFDRGFEILEGTAKVAHADQDFALAIGGFGLSERSRVDQQHFGVALGIIIRALGWVSQNTIGFCDAREDLRRLLFDVRESQVGQCVWVEALCGGEVGLADFRPRRAC